MLCDTPFFVLPKAATQKVPVPCGRCPPCKLRRVNSWVFRMLQEHKGSSFSHFVTLTYDTNHVPITDHGFMTLSKRDVQLYFKRLRKLCPSASLRYYLAGEYGTDRSRPHYHAIIFNVSDPSYFSDAWGLGQVVVGSVTSDSIAYTMKYIDKPHTSRKHSRDDRISEFSLMSKGLGNNYLTAEVIAYHQSDVTRNFVTKEGGHRIALPRYYRQRIYSDEQLRQQVFHIQHVVEQTELLDFQEFSRLYSDVPNYTYSQYVDTQRMGRYHNFYSQLQTRKL